MQRGEKRLNIRRSLPARLGTGFKGVHMKAYYGMNYQPCKISAFIIHSIGRTTEPGIYKSFPRAACGLLLKHGINLFVLRSCQMSDKDRLIEMNTSELPTDVTNVQRMPFQLTCFGPFSLFLPAGKKLLVKMSLGPMEPRRAAGFDFLGLIIGRKAAAWLQTGEKEAGARQT